MQGWEAGIRTATLKLHKQGFLWWTGEVSSTFEGAVSATRALFLLEEKVKFTSSTYSQVLYMYTVKELSFILPFSKCLCQQ